MLLKIYNKYRNLELSSFKGETPKERRETFTESFSKDLIQNGYVTDKGAALKSGKFAELLIREVATSTGFEVTDGPKIKAKSKMTKKDYFKPDGYIEELDIYLESKNYQFFSTGTANEKLYGFLAKASLYNKPVALVFVGQHEKRMHDECKSIWEIYHNNSEFDNHVFAPAIKKLRDEGKLFVTTVLELPKFLNEMKNKALLNNQ